MGARKKRTRTHTYMHTHTHTHTHMYIYRYIHAYKRVFVCVCVCVFVCRERERERERERCTISCCTKGFCDSDSNRFSWLEITFFELPISLLRFPISPSFDCNFWTIESFSFLQDSFSLFKWAFSSRRICKLIPSSFFLICQKEIKRYI